MEEIATPPPPPSPEPEDCALPLPRIERASTTALILLVTIPTDALYMHSAMYQRVPKYAVGFIILSWLIGNLLMFLPWSALWALAGKVFQRRARFFGHLNTALLAGLIWSWIRVALDIAVFAASADAFRVFPYFFLLGAVISALLWGHLRLVSAAGRPRLAVIALLIGGFLVGIASGVRALGISRVPAARTAEMTVLPHFLRCAAPGSIDSQLKALDDLKVAVDARAKEP